MLEIGREFGLTRVRVPAEPPAVLARCGTPVGFGARALYQWTRVLRRQVRAAGMATTDHCFGLAWSGHMTPDPRAPAAGKRNYRRARARSICTRRSVATRRCVED